MCKRYLLQRFQTYWPYLLVTVLVMGPLWLPGYIFTLDLAFTPTMPTPTSLAPDYLWELLLHGLSLVVPSWLLEKIILTSIPLASCLGMHRLLHYLSSNPPSIRAVHWRAAIYSGAILYAINPFTYSRFMAGQYAVLLGYAILPWCLWLALRWTVSPTTRASIGLGLVITGSTILSVHSIGLLAIVVGSVFVLGLITKTAPRAKLVQGMGICIGTCLLASSYWLVPILLGKGQTAAAIHSFDASHAAAFASLGDSILTKTLAILSLQGFWAEGRELYRLPQDQLPLWGTIRLLWWVVVALGFGALYSHARKLWVLLGSIASIGLLAALGTLQPILTAIGYREPHKFTALIALVFSVATAYGIAWLANRTAHHETKRLTILSGICVAIILLTAPMYGGFGGQLRPRQYPSEWYALNTWFTHQAPGTAVFVPWHQYLGLDFAGRIVANPASNFFERPVIVSQDPELGRISTSVIRHQQALTDVLRAPSRNTPTPVSTVLASQHIRYIIVSSSYQPGTYASLATDPHLKKIWHNRSLVVYLNTLYKE